MNTEDLRERVRSLIVENAGKPVAEKVEIFSRFFLGVPYLGEALGEGDQGKYDRDPLYRFDAFDCTTYVETVMALSLASDFDAFVATMLRIRYKDGLVSFTTRNHFPEIDWIPNNIAAGFLRDISQEVAGDQPVEVAETIIDKPGWYGHLPLSMINVPDATDSDRERLWHELRAEGAAFAPVAAVTPYLSLRVMFPEGVENVSLLDRIPSGTVMNVIRPNWNPGEQMGTHLNVSHQAILIRKDGVLMMRHASSREKNVVEVPLVPELRGYLPSPTIRGVSLFAVH